MSGKWERVITNLFIRSAKFVRPTRTPTPVLRYSCSAANADMWGERFVTRETTRVISFRITALGPGPLGNRAMRKEEGTDEHEAGNEFYPLTCRAISLAREPAQRIFLTSAFPSSWSNMSEIGWLHIGIFVYVNQTHRRSLSPCPTFSYVNIHVPADPTRVQVYTDVERGTRYSDISKHVFLLVKLNYALIMR